MPVDTLSLAPASGDDDLVAPGAQRADRPAARTPAERLSAAARIWVPLMAMALVAIFTWWLVRQQPRPDRPKTPKVLSQEPDYTLQGLTLEYFGPEGERLVTLTGQALRHYPGSDEVHIDAVRLDGRTRDGRPLTAAAASAVADGGGDWARLQGGAVVTSQDRQGQSVRVEAQALTAHLKDERVTADSSVQVDQGASRIRAGGLVYDVRADTVTLTGHIEATLTPPRQR